MPLQATSGAASYDAFGGGAAAVPTYIEDVFSTWLYAGTGAGQTITNGIDLAGKGGLVWTKARNDTSSNILINTANGFNYLISNGNFAQFTTGSEFSSFNTTGYTLGAYAGLPINQGGFNYASWTFRKQPKFFDVVTYTGNGTSGRSISHSLNSIPACMIVKSTGTAENWMVYHRSLNSNEALNLNRNVGVQTGAYWNSQRPTSTVFYVGNLNDTNQNGVTYVAYLFANDDGGFGLTGTDNVVSCGSYIGNSSSTGPTITLGYEPQWIMIKSSSTGGNGYNWYMYDNMRGLPAFGGGSAFSLSANVSNAEVQGPDVALTATGFTIRNNGVGTNESGQTYIYVAIRRGPMKVPTTGTSVYVPTTTTSTDAFSVGFPADLGMFFMRQFNVSTNTTFSARLTSNDGLVSSSAAPRVAGQMIFTLQNSFRQDISANSAVCYTLRRSPSFFDVVCYTGTGSARTVAHNLTVAPELMIIKKRSDTDDWAVYAGDNTDFLLLNTTAATADDNTYWNDTGPTSTVLSVGTNADVNTSAATYVAYLFATCPGVSKVGSFTGTGATQVINCGFTGGARFVLIKATSTTGDWYVWDSARGIVAGNDPYLRLNSTAAEVTNTDWVDAAASGFELSNAGGNLVNSNGVSYVFLAVA